MNNEYRISAIKDFLAVPPESIDACLADFKQWLRIAREQEEFAADVNALLGIPNGAAFFDDSFTWVDDGIAGISRVDLVDAENGEHIARISIDGISVDEEPA